MAVLDILILFLGDIVIKLSPPKGHDAPLGAASCFSAWTEQSAARPPIFTKVIHMKCVFLAAALFGALLIPAAQAAPKNFFNDLSGSWSGSGKAYVAKYGEISANCRVAISGAETKVAMKGSCGMLVFRQALGLSIRNAGGNNYVGTYTGSSTGPARLEGTLRGDRLVMTIKWGGLVNGDRTAQMVLQRTGPNSFAQTVNDTVEGKSRRTSNFAFVRANTQAAK